MKFKPERKAVSIAESVKADIFATFKLNNNKTQTAAVFGLSPRTVGRVLAEMHVADASNQAFAAPHAPNPSAAACEACAASELAEIREQLAKLQELVASQQTSVVYIKYREPLNLEILNAKQRQVASGDYACIYAPGTSVMTIYSVDVPSGYVVPDKVTEDFLHRHPVSPGCAVFPYEPSEGKLPNDPPKGKHCNCDTCQHWRGQLRLQERLMHIRQHAIVEQKIARVRA